MHDLDAVESTCLRLKATFKSGKTKSYSWRMDQLRQLNKLIIENETAMIEALRQDLGRCAMEASALDLVLLTSELRETMNHLKDWMKPTYTSVSALVAPAVSEIVYEPYGLVLNIGPFNYPIQLMLVPLMAAIAAGNCVICKPSELAPACETLIAKLIPQYLDRDCFAVFVGDIPMTKQLLHQKFDKIFFTGSTRVGKIVMEAAAKHLTPLTLELGGKSPCYVDRSVTDMALVCKRIAWGKFVNAGQTCIAPDYVLVHEEVYDLFLKTMASTVGDFYGKTPKSNTQFARIISAPHCERLQRLISGAGGRLVCGGEVDVREKYVSPTVIADIDHSTSALMHDEIFGPIMPVMTVKDEQAAIDVMHLHEKPLALYMFGKDREVFDRITGSVTSGGVCVNDTLMHIVNGSLPFGGVGPSGQGGYHGKYSFEAFSHRRSILRRDDHAWLDVPIRYPPYTDSALAMFKKASTLPSLPAILPRTLKLATAAIFATAALSLSLFYGKFFKEL